MGIRKRRIQASEARDLEESRATTEPPAVPSEPQGPAPEIGHDVEVLEYELVGSQFTIDALVARLNSEGVEIVRSSPFELNVLAGGIARLGEHKIIFKASDKAAVGEALRAAGLL